MTNPPLSEVLAPLFEIAPLEQSMPRLVGFDAPRSEVVNVVKKLLENFQQPLVAAALWLYAEDFERSHSIAQGIESPLGAYWHGILHRREGDFWNSKYWFRRAKSVSLPLEGYEPVEMVDSVSLDHEANQPKLIDLQRREWIELTSLSFVERT